MAKIFLSYRRQDSAGVTGRIYDRLRAHFGDDAVFMDIDSIPFGEDFREHIGAAVGRADLVLAVIGPRWSGKTQTSRRIDDPRDFVRIEIESAIQRGIPVIPVLLDRTRMPTEAEVPPSLATLTYRNAIEVDQGRDFHPHVDRLIRGIEFKLGRVKVTAAHLSNQPNPASASLVVAIEKAGETPSNLSAQPERVSKVDIPRDYNSNNSDSPRAVIAKPQDTDDLKRVTHATSTNAIVLVADSNVSVPCRLDGSPNSTGELESASLPTQRTHSRLAPFLLASAGVPVVDRKEREIRRPWLYLGVPGALASLAILIYTATDYGAVKISGTEYLMEVSIDGAQIPLDDLGRSITLRTGGHFVLVTRRGVVLKTETFQIKRGQETPLKVTYIRDPPGRPANSIGMKFVGVPVGEFLMGSSRIQVDKLVQQFLDFRRDSCDDEQPQHLVKISRRFFLGIHEVTQGQYQAVMDKNPSQFKGSEDMPVENVSWLEAIRFCNKLSEREKRTPFYRVDGNEVTVGGGNGYRLPTEAEWEYACRASSTTLCSFGDDASMLSENAWSSGNADNKSHRTGQKLPNDWGLFDMLGNVWEWCADSYDEKRYESPSTADHSDVSTASTRVIRGCCWNDEPRFCRPARRGKWPTTGTELRGSTVGFRVAADMD